VETNGGSVQGEVRELTDAGVGDPNPSDRKSSIGQDGVKSNGPSAAASSENAVFGADLTTFIRCWLSLAEAVCAGILAMIQATKAP